VTEFAHGLWHFGGWAAAVCLFLASLGPRAASRLASTAAVACAIRALAFWIFSARRCWSAPQSGSSLPLYIAAVMFDVRRLRRAEPPRNLGLRLRNAIGHRLVLRQYGFDPSGIERRMPALNRPAMAGINSGWGRSLL
jgi:hypothetical protein